jgi:N4-gp56 family major capsid protein
MAVIDAASVISSGLGAFPTLYFDKVALDALEKTLVLYDGIETKTLPDRSGSTLRMFDNSSMAANTTPATEGTPGTGLAITENTRDIAVDNYVDFLTISHKVDRMHLVDALEEGVNRLSYRGALSVDTVIREVFDAAANADSATRIEINDGSYLTAAKIRQAKWSLSAVDVMPKDDGAYFGVTHSLTAFDLSNESGAGGLLDLQKYTEALAQKNVAGQPKNSIMLDGVKLRVSNNMKSYANWQSSANTAYSTFVIGKNAVIGASLGKTKLGQKNFQVEVKRFDKGSAADPGSTIVGAVAYNLFFGCAKRPGSTNGFRRIRSEASIA